MDFFQFKLILVVTSRCFFFFYIFFAWISHCFLDQASSIFNCQQACKIYFLKYNHVLTGSTSIYINKTRDFLLYSNIKMNIIKIIK